MIVAPAIVSAASRPVATRVLSATGSPESKWPILKSYPSSSYTANYLYHNAMTLLEMIEYADRRGSGLEYVVALLLRDSGTRTVAVTDSALSSELRTILGRLSDPKVEVVGDQTGVVELIVNRLPVPSEDIPLEAILDFVNSEETQRRLARLDLWTQRAVQSGRELQDLRLEMEESLNDFGNHMRLADMRSENSLLRIALSLPLAVIEELIHLRPRGAFDVVFEYRGRKASRLEAELAAPGGALAYVYEAERRFGA